MKTKKFNYWWLLLCLPIFYSCNDDEGGMDVFIKKETYSQPTVDQVVTTFSGKVALLGAGDEIVAYLQKRFPKIETELTDETTLLILNEELAKNWMEDAESYETLQRYWYKNRVVAFVKPSVNALSLLMKLQEREIDQTTYNELLDGFNQFAVYAAKADGTDYSYNKLIEEDEVEITDINVKEDKNGQTSETTTSGKLIERNKFNDFNKGQIAEAIVKWMNKNAINKEAKSDVAFVRTRGESLLSSVNAVTNTRERSITFTYTLPWDVNHLDSDEGKPDSAITVTATHSASIIGVYDMTNNRDLYDVEFNQNLNASITTKDRLNQITYEKAAYNWKYTAGVYTGPTVEGTILCNNPNFVADKVSFIEPSPIYDATKEEYTLTHYPAQHTLGFSLMGSKGISAGTSGVSAEKSKGKSFSYSCTLPYETETKVITAMKPVYASSNGMARWYYPNIHYVYKAVWGQNPKYNNPYDDACHNECDTKQFVTYGVPNSRKLEKTTVKLQMKTGWNFYEESANPWGDRYQRMRCFYQTVTFNMPIVYRYFGEYRPECYYSNVSASENDWGNINVWLMANQYYKDFNDESLSVGGRTEEELKENANRMWEEAITSMAKQFENGLGVKDGHYIITIYCATDDVRSNKGLYIHDDIVEVIDNPKAKAEEIKNMLAAK